ncbi:MAG TPA: TonB-dependent receptor [Rhodocyclaceae bacterium]|nr:TonB-dependent receptor [Rhodocyclaceae bacterium]
MKTPRTLLPLLALPLSVPGASAQQPVELAPIIVTATRYAMPVDETPVASFVVGAKEMERRNLKSLDEAVNLIPGVFQRRGKGMMDTLNALTLRGVPDAKRSLIMLDGLPINDAYTNGADLGGFAPEDIERVEVVLGPGSSLYGSSAMGGVVNFVSRMPKGEEYRFRIGYGDGLSTDRAPAHLARAYVSAGNAWENGLSLLLSGATSRTDGYATDEVRSTTAPPAGISGAIPTLTTTGGANYIIGDKGDNGWRDSQISLRAAQRVDAKTALNASYSRVAYRYDYDDTRTYLRNAVGAPVWTYTVGATTVREAAFLPGQGQTVRDILGLGAETLIGASRLKLQAGMVDVGTNWYTTVSSTSATATRAGGAAANGYSQTPSRSIQAEASVTTPLLDHHQLIWGLTWRSEKADTTEFDLADWRDPASRTNRVSWSGGEAATTGAFGQAEIEVMPAVRAFVGLRYDHWKASDGYAGKTGAGAFSRTYAGKSENALSPRLGATWNVTPEAMLRASVGRAFRAPNIYDLYRTWRSTAGTVFAGNPDLTPETMTGIDLGGDFKPWSGGELKLTAYRNDFEDMIYRRTVTNNAEALSLCGQALNPPQNNNCRVWSNAGKARGNGAELSLRQRLSDAWSASLGYAWNDTEIIENATNPASVGKQFTQVPEHTVTLAVDWRVGAWDASASARHVAKRFGADDNSDTVSGVPGAYDAYTLVDLKLGYRINKNLKAALSIDNVFNRDYYASYRAPGRSWFVEFSGAF